LAQLTNEDRRFRRRLVHLPIADDQDCTHGTSASRS
jgi:hypothetical protein